ncbi:uncharacterized protein N7459_006152 [Penicillium hispanicum]|uniref:uncharacterized protein n=1 Tax=Penicillium hispanicum TaxID=1080232 RepID=UPI0025425A4A|nr:uncharacterized protein N7459_006152 [Penicillium hispanicum]KAJ5580167.1 hypothetical protein N7459_006152 [Penicillium hispanicum]
MTPLATEEMADSDSDIEFEDVPLPSAQASTSNHMPSNGIHPSGVQLPRQPWTPTLSLPQQRAGPVPAGSEDETQLRGRLSTGIERINYRQMKSVMGMDAPDDRASSRRYESFKELALDVEGLVDMLWASATPSIATEGLITLAGILEMALPTHTFDPPSTLTILSKFDAIFAALCTGLHPLTESALPGADSGRPLVTQTQKVRIRSLAETTRNQIFLLLPDPDEGDGGDENENESADEQPWLMEATRVYDRTLMLLAD